MKRLAFQWGSSIIGVAMVTACSPTATRTAAPLAAPTIQQSAAASSSSPRSATPATASPAPPAAIRDRNVTPITIKLPAPDAWGKVAASADAIWVGFDNGLWRVDPATDTVAKTVELGLSPDFLAFGFNSLWVTNFDSNVVVRVDARSGKVLARIVSQAPQGVVTTSEGVWVANHHSGAVTFIDPKTNQRGNGVVAGPAGDNGPQGMTGADGKVWVGISSASDVVGVDPAAHTVATTISKVQQPCGDMAASGETLWVSECEEKAAVDEVDLAAGAFVRSTAVGGFVGTPIPVADGAWLPLNGPARLLKVSDSSGQPIDAVGLPPDCAFSGLSGATEAFGSIWISCRLSLLRFNPSDLP